MSKWLRPLKVREYYLDLHFDSIKAICSTPVTVPAIISSSHRRPRAIAAITAKKPAIGGLLRLRFGLRGQRFWLECVFGRFVSGRRNPVSPMQIDLGQLAGFDVSPRSTDKAQCSLSPGSPTRARGC